MWLRIGWVMFALIVLSVNILRFVGLENSPPGFHVDELSGAVMVQCLVTEGLDAKGEPRFPLLFGDLRYGTPRPPTYIYPAMLWTRIFGFSIASFRALIAFFVVMTILGIVILARFWLGSIYAGVAAVLATISPWGWMFSRISYEPMIGVFFMVWGLVIHFRFKGWLSGLWSGAFFAGAMYSYPPLRLLIPLLIIVLFIFHWFVKGVFFKSKSISNECSSLSAFFVLCLPLGYYLLFKDLQSRFGEIGIHSADFLNSIGSDGNFFDLLKIFAMNFVRHFDPRFLMFSGSENVMHSSGFSGILSWVESVSLVIGILWAFLEVFRSGRDLKSKMPEWSLLVFLGIMIVLGVVPSSLTWEGIPHALRAVIVWPFVCWLLAYPIFALIKRWSVIMPLTAVLAILFSGFFLHFYFYKYPAHAYGMYSPWAKEEAMAARTDQDWIVFTARYSAMDYHACYYLMNYAGETCSSSRDKWNKVRRYVERH